MSDRPIWGSCNAAYLDGYRAGGGDAMSVAEDKAETVPEAEWAPRAVRLRSVIRLLKASVNSILGNR